MIEEKRLEEILKTIGVNPFEIREKANYYLSDEFVEILAIQNGISLPTHKITHVPVMQKIPQPTHAIYEVSGFSYKFNDTKIAQKLQQFLQENASSIVGTDYNSSCGYNYSYMKSVSTDYYGSFSQQNVFTVEEYNDVSATLRSNKQVREAFDKAKKASDEQSEDYNDLSNAIKDAVSDACSIASQWDSLSCNFTKYEAALGYEAGMEAFVKVEKPGDLFIEWIKDSRIDSEKPQGDNTDKE